jgi:hypothetical protein
MIERIESDEQAILIALYGSRALEMEKENSDYDIIVVLKEIFNEGVHGLHYHNKGCPQIDFIIMTEQIVHSDKIPVYLQRCILPKCKIIYSKCDKCLGVISTKYKYSNNRILLAEQENIYWHLKNIIYKASRYNAGSIERMVFWSKYVYYLTLLWPRFFNHEIQGESDTLRNEWSDKLRDFLRRNASNIPSIEKWEDFLLKTPIGIRMKHKKIFCEVSELIQPYSPPSISYEYDHRIKKHIRNWIRI